MAEGYDQFAQSFNKEDWRDKAACAEMDTSFFFPSGKSGEALEKLERAKAFCGACAVQDECLDFAIQTNQQHGVWGGKSEEERRLIRRLVARDRRTA